MGVEGITMRLNFPLPSSLHIVLALGGVVALAVAACGGGNTATGTTGGDGGSGGSPSTTHASSTTHSASSSSGTGGTGGTGGATGTGGHGGGTGGGAPCTEITLGAF